MPSLNCLFAALRVCQTVRLEKHSHKHQEFVQYCHELRSCITRMDSEITHRLLLRSQAFPTVCCCFCFTCITTDDFNIVYFMCQTEPKNVIWTYLTISVHCDRLVACAVRSKMDDCRLAPGGLFADVFKEL